MPSPLIHPRYTRAVQIIMHTCQRVEKIARLNVSQWKADERILDSSKSEELQTTRYPVVRARGGFLNAITPNEYGLLFPLTMDQSIRVSRDTHCLVMWRQREHGGAIPMSRTATCAGPSKPSQERPASKEIRNRLQNHALPDVSSKHLRRA